MAWKTLAILGLALTLIGALTGAWRGTLRASSVIVASSAEDFATQQRRVMRWLKAGLWMIAAGPALQLVAVWIAP